MIKNGRLLYNPTGMEGAAGWLATNRPIMFDIARFVLQVHISLWLSKLEVVKFWFDPWLSLGRVYVL